MGREAKNAIHAIRTPTLRELGWAAGFLEGEGTFKKSLTNRAGGEQVSAVQVNPEPLTQLQQLFGGRVIKYTQIKTTGNESDYWSWEVSGAKARGIMLTIYHLLSYKRQQQIKKAIC